MANENAEAKSSYVFDKLKFAFDSAMSVIQKSVKDRKGLDPLKDLVDAEEDTPEGKKELDAVRIEWETTTPHELGKYQLTKGLESPKLEADKTYLLVGSVDRTAFDKKLKREGVVMYKTDDGHDVNWYEDVSGTASEFLSFKDYIETNFKSWDSPAKKERLLSIVKVVSEMTEFTDAAWQKMIKDGGFTDNEIYGSEGVYNLLLAFNRASESTSSALEEGLFAAAKGKFSPNVFKIRLEVAGKAGGKDDNARYSRLISTKVNEDNIKMEEEDEGTPTPDATPPTPDATPPVPDVTPPVPDVTKAQKTPEELESEKRVADKIKEFEDNGFTFVKKPSLTESGYAIYGTDKLNADGNVVEKFAKRVVIALSEIQDAGKNTFVMFNALLLNLPDGHVTTNTDFIDDSETLKSREVLHSSLVPSTEVCADAKALKDRLEADDVKEFSDSVKSLYYDLAYAPGYNVTVGKTALTGEDPLTNAPYDNNTYEVTVKDTVIDVGTGADAKRVNVPEAKFEVTLKLGDPMPYTGYVGEKGVTETTTPAEFLKNAVRLFYDEHPTATP